MSRPIHLRIEPPIVISRASRAFTLVELLVSMALLAVVMLVTATIVNHTRGVWQQTTGKIAAFRESRAGFESLTRRLSQASLNTYFDYVDASNRTPKEVEEAGGVFTPDQYLRQSELHLVTGQASSLVPAAAGTTHPGHGTFFQAPLGFSSTPATGDADLANLLNAVGYYVEYGSDDAWRPSFLSGIIPPKNRYRLMQMLQSTERLGIYENSFTDANRFDWFQTPLANATSPARPVAENIIMAIVWPRRSENDPGTPLTTDYSYDTKAYLSGTNQISRNQLPPYVQVTLVAIDEPSAARLEEKYGGSAPLLQPGALFTESPDPTNPISTKLNDDLEQLTDFLADENLNYRVFTTNVLIRQAKFSAD
jgi:uncharacterized protein (TIGR02599 family)